MYNPQYTNDYKNSEEYKELTTLLEQGYKVKFLTTKTAPKYNTIYVVNTYVLEK